MVKKKKKDKKRPEFLVLKNQCQYKTLISGSEKMVEKQSVYCEQVLALGDGGGWGGEFWDDRFYRYLGVALVSTLIWFFGSGTNMSKGRINLLGFVMVTKMLVFVYSFYTFLSFFPNFFKQIFFVQGIFITLMATCSTIAVGSFNIQFQCNTFLVYILMRWLTKVTNM